MLIARPAQVANLGSSHRRNERDLVLRQILDDDPPLLAIRHDQSHLIAAGGQGACLDARELAVGFQRRRERRCGQGQKKREEPD